MIPRLSKSVKFEASYGRCHKVKFFPWLSSIPDPIRSNAYRPPFPKVFRSHTHTHKKEETSAQVETVDDNK
jgi:hypothetical protein